MDKSDGVLTGPRGAFDRRSCECAVGGKSAAFRRNMVSDVENTAGFQWMGARLTARASSETLRILEKGGLKFLYPWCAAGHGQRCLDALGGFDMRAKSHIQAGEMLANARDVPSAEVGGKESLRLRQINSSTGAAFRAFKLRNARQMAIRVDWCSVEII